MRAIIVLLLVLLGVPGVAAAQCPAPYTSDNVLAELVNVEEFLRKGDNAAAAKAAEQLLGGLDCLNELLPQMLIGRMYRAIGAGMYAGGDELGGFDWFLTALEADPTFEYGVEDMSPDHPARLAYQDAKLEIQGEPVARPEAAFGPGNHYLDGHQIDTPAARLGRPHLYQLERDGEIRSWVISSNDFPDEAFAGDAVAMADDGGRDKKKKDKKKKKDRRKKDEDSGGDSGIGEATLLVRERPWEKTPLMVGGGLVIAGAGGLYALSMMNHQEFEEAGTEDEVRRLAKATNQLVIASGAVLAVGAGTLTWGIILEGGTPVPSIGFRF